jgi:hypothetical protein
MGTKRTSLRFTGIEQSSIRAFAQEERISQSEAIRRLVFLKEASGLRPVHQ